MPRYIVDLRSLERHEREAAYRQIDKLSFMTTMILGEEGLEGADVVWNLKEDFESSPAYPKGCPCKLVAH